MLDNSLLVWAYQFSERDKKLPGFSQQIGALEFFAILCNVLIFKDHLSGMHIDALTDSKSSEAVVNLRYSRKDKVAASLLRELLISVATMNSSIMAHHVPGDSMNTIADILSRDGILAL